MLAIWIPTVFHWKKQFHEQVLTLFCSFFSNPILNAIQEDSKDDSAIKAEFGTNQNLKNGEDLEEEDENDEEFFTPDFEPIIQV